MFLSWCSLGISRPRDNHEQIKDYEFSLTLRLEQKSNSSHSISMLQQNKSSEEF